MSPKKFLNSSFLKLSKLHYFLCFTTDVLHPSLWEAPPKCIAFARHFCQFLSGEEEPISSTICDCLVSIPQLSRTSMQQLSYFIRIGNPLSRMDLTSSFPLNSRAICICRGLRTMLRIFVYLCWKPF